MSTEGQVLRPGDMRYGIADVPRPFPLAVGLGLQHVLTMFGATVAVPLLLGPAVGLDQNQMAILVSAVMISAGVATFIQVQFGTRLPIIQGMSFSFLGPIFAIIATTAGEGATPTGTMQAIAGALIGGAIVEAAIGYSGLFGKIREFISPVVIGPVIALIGLSLYQVGAPQAAGNWWLASFVVLAVFLFALVLSRGVKLFSLFPILLAVGAAYVLAWILSVAGVIAEGSPGYVDFAGVGVAEWVRNPIDVVFPWGGPTFKIGFFLGMLAGYLASMIESFGDYHTISHAAGAGVPTKRQINRGIGAEGVACVFTGVFGAFGSTSYTENIGLVALTKVASRYVVLIAAGILVVLGFVAKFGALVATIPGPIVGGMYLTLFGLIASIGLAVSTRADLSSQRNQMIIGFCLFLGLSLPFYMQDVELTFRPDWLAEIVKTVGSTGMAVAAIAGLLLDNLIPGTRAERGLDTYYEGVQTEVTDPGHG